MFKAFTKNITPQSAGHKNKKIKAIKDCSGDPDCPMCRIAPEVIKQLQTDEKKICQR